MKQKFPFPKGFLWGAATAAHQIEGNNIHSDWWAWEHSPKRENFLKSKGLSPSDFYSGMACDSYNRFDEDFALAEHLNHSAHRLSVEWAKIEPREGLFDEKVLDHYEKVLQSAKFHGLKTFVTLHHFTSPLWFMKKSGFVKKENLNHFIKFARRVGERLNEYVDFWLTVNEPEVYCTQSYIVGNFPPNVHSLSSAWKVALNLIEAHKIIAEYVRVHLRKPVSMAFHLSDLQPSGPLGGWMTQLAHYFANEYILKRTIESCDFIGVNYYFHHHIGLFGPRKRSHSQHELTDMGWGIHPEGLERVLLNLRKYQKPIYITENGLADAKDTKREKYIKDHLYYVHRAIEKGADVRGYLYWSLVDNFEWNEGFGPRFGLVEIDRQDMLRRKVRFSALKYAEICKTNVLEI